MRITSVSISDTFGTKEAKFSPKSLTLIRGCNGSGKSSILSALKYIFAGGCDPAVLRRGASKSIVSFTLDTGHIVTKKTFLKKTRGGEPNGYDYTLEVLSPDGLPVPAPMSFVNRLSEAVAVDPGEILRIDTSTASGRKQLAELLLRLMPIEFSPEEIAATINAEYREGAEVRIHDPKALALPDFGADALDLDGLKKYCGLVTEQRRRIGIVREEAGGSANDLRRSLPDGTDDLQKLSAELQKAEDYRRAVEAAIAARKADIEKERTDALALAKDKWQKAVQETNADIDTKIRALEAERTRANDSHRKLRDDEDTAISATATQEYVGLEAESQPEMEKAISNVARLKQVHANSQKSIVLREQIEKADKKAQEHAIKYDLLSEVLLRLDKLRRNKLDSLPVPGLEVSDGAVTVGGVEWRLVNTAKRVTVALQLCCLRAGDGSFLFLDNAEALDQETRQAIEEGVVAEGFQLFECLVTDSPQLTIETKAA